MTLRNCTVSGNTPSVQAGAIHHFAGLLVIDSCTITGNSGGLRSNNPSGSTTQTQVRNTIISGNSVADVLLGFPGLPTSIQSNGYNLVGTGDTGAFTQTNDATGITNAGLVAPLEVREMYSSRISHMAA